ncbi:tetratricopeptide repeat protein [Chloroherpeton thalassium]|nr:hypothetical protein [Chloroherpeton thalassium]
MFLSSSSAKQYGLEDISVSSNVIGYEEYLNDILAKERYLEYLSSNLKISVSEKDGGFRADYERYEAKHEKYSPILIGNYGYKGGSEGRFFNFEEKKEYDRFVEYLRFYNIKSLLKSYRNAIIYNSSSLEVRELFEREVNSASRSYKVGDYATSRLQFEDIYESYKPFYKENLDEVLFLWAESSFGLRYFSEAKELYSKIISEYSSSNRKELAAYRVIFMDYVYDDANQFLSDFNKYRAILEKDKILWDKSLLIAATIEYGNKHYAKAISLLDQISQDVDNIVYVNFIRGVIFIELNDISEAKKSFKDVTNISIWPWSNKINSYLKNSAFLQLGYINYKEGNEYMSKYEDAFAKGDTTASALSLRQDGVKRYENAENFFASVSKGYAEYRVAEIAKLWTVFKESDYRESKKSLDKYLNHISLEDDLYQAVYLSGYMTQKNKPSSLDESLKDYYYVYNGMAANEYLKKYFSYVRTLKELKNNVSVFVEHSVSPAEKKAASSLYELLNGINELLIFNYKDIVNSEKTVFTESKKNELQNYLYRLGETKDSLATNGFLNLANFAQSSLGALNGLVKMNVEPISDDIKLFLEHATVFLENEKKDYENLIEEYKKQLNTESEVVSYQLDVAKSVSVKNEKEAVLIDYYVNNANLIKNRNSSLQTLFHEKSFYEDNHNIENTGTTAQYAFSGMIYEQITGRQKQIDNYRKIVGLLKNAARKKIEQLEFYLKEIDKDYSVGPGLRKVEELQQEFDNIYQDFRRAFFEGTEHLKMTTGGSDSKEDKTLQ